MSKPKSFRIIILSIICLFIGIVFASQLPSVKGETEKTNSTQSKIKESKNLLANLLPSPSPTPEIPHTLVGSYYLVDENIEAKLLLNNKGSIPLEVQPTLYNKQGQELQLPPVTVEPQSFRFINLADWAGIGGESFRSGNIKLFHYGKDLVLGAQIYLTDETRSLSYEEKLTEKGKFDSRRQEAVWWMPSNDAKVRIVLTNTTDAPLSVTGRLAKKPDTVSNPQTVELAAHQTKVFDLRDDFPNGSQFINAEILALSLEHSGAKDALLARVMVAETQRGYSNVVQFSNPNGGKSSEYQGVGFQIEDIDGIRFAPIITVRNVGTTAATITARVPYTRTDGTRGAIALPQKQLSAGEMGLINTQNIISRVQQENIKVASLEVEYNSAPGSVIVAAHSVSEDHNQVFRVPMWDPFGQRSPTGGYPWRIEGTSRTETYIKNIADYEEDYVAYLVWENGGEYMIGLKSIAARETVHIDVKKLRDEQIPDEQGRVIPPWISSGQLQWTLRRKDNQPDDDTRANLALIGRSEQVDISKGITNNYACQNCCESTTTGFITANPSPTDVEHPNYDLEFGDTVQLYAFEAIWYCYAQPGDLPQIYSKATNNWESDNTSIATVTSTGLVTIEGVGEVEIDTDWRVTNYIYAGDCPPEIPGLVSTEQCENQPPKKANETKPDTLAPDCGACFSNRPSISPEVNIFSRKLEILRNGQVISDINSPVQNVVVGEKIELTTRVVGTAGTQSNRQWTIPGTRIANYEVTYTNSSSPSSGVLTELTSQNLTQSSIQFYWVDGADARNVQYSVKVNNRIYTAIAKFNVKRPTVTVSSTTHTTTIYTAGQRQELLFGEIGRFGRSTNGITFTRSDFQVPTGFTGNTYWVQVIDYAFTRTLPDGQTTQTSSGIGLDAVFPYSSRDPNADSTADSPGVCLRICDETVSKIKMQTRIDATMWLMFKPSGDNSIYVPLKKVSWNWSAIATRQPDFLWSLTSSSNSQNPSGNDTTSFPQWTKIVGNEPYQ